MNYRNKIIAELTQLENYARTCFVVHLHLPNGQGRTVNGFIDKFMEDLTGGEMDLPNMPDKFKNGCGRCQVLLDVCLYYLLPQCREAENPNQTDLFVLVGEWIQDNLKRCAHCGEWFIPDPDEWPNDVCPECVEECND